MYFLCVLIFVENTGAADVAARLVEERFASGMTCASSLPSNP
jgi:hypothetical protein